MCNAYSNVYYMNIPFDIYSLLSDHTTRVAIRSTRFPPSWSAIWRIATSGQSPTLIETCTNKYATDKCAHIDRELLLPSPPYAEVWNHIHLSAHHKLQLVNVSLNTLNSLSYLHKFSNVWMRKQEEIDVKYTFYFIYTLHRIIFSARTRIFRIDSNMKYCHNRMVACSG